MILVERGDQFERVLKPRVAKAAYTDTWRKGAPQTVAPVSVCYRVIDLQGWR